jgi:GGDEF domain-containing protein
MVMCMEFVVGQELSSPLFLHVPLDIEIVRMKRFGFVFSVVTLKIENFEELSTENRTSVLTGVAEDLEGLCRLVDLKFYTGWGHFDLILPGRRRCEAEEFAERLQKVLNGTFWLEKALENLKYSIQVASFPEDGKTKQEFIQSWNGLARNERDP